MSRQYVEISDIHKTTKICQGSMSKYQTYTKQPKYVKAVCRNIRHTQNNQNMSRQYVEISDIHKTTKTCQGSMSKYQTYTKQTKYAKAVCRNIRHTQNNQNMSRQYVEISDIHKTTKTACQGSMSKYQISDRQSFICCSHKRCVILFLL